ncbi:MAG: response regulator [Pirellulaceae bacterium]|nr:response regulator [Pirellulaceae bacterium]
MNSAQSHPALTKAAHAIVTDNRAETQLNTELFLAEHSDHVAGLLFRAWTASSLDTAYYCLQRALELEPGNLVAKAGMNWMQGVWTLAHQQIEFDRRERDKISQERLQQELLEQERIEQAAQLEQERQQKEWERKERERLEQAQLEQERLEQQQRERERLEQQFLEQQRLEQQRLEQQRLEQQRLEQQRLEQQRLEQERLEQERLEQERLEQERLEQERLEQARLEQSNLQHQLFEQQLLEQCRLQQEQQKSEEQVQPDLDPAPLILDVSDSNPKTPILDASQESNAEADLSGEAGSLRIFCSDEEDIAEEQEIAVRDSIEDQPEAQDQPAATDGEENHDANHAKIEKFWAKMPQLDIPELAGEQESLSPEEPSEPVAESQLQDFVRSLAQEVRDEVTPLAAKNPPFLNAEVSPRKTNHLGANSDIRKPLILAVDDSPTIRKLVTITLSEKGHDVVTAPDGVEALKLLAERLPDLILLDINMPRLSGYKLCNFLKKHERTAHIPVIMLSGNDGVIDKMRGKIKGCDAFIGKPFAPEDLVKTVNQHLQYQTS